MKNMKSHSIFVRSILWTARVLGAFQILTSLVIGIGEMADESQPEGFLFFFKSLGVAMQITMLFWLAGLVCLAWAFWNELKGGLSSLILFVLVILMALFNPQANFQVTLFAFLLPSALFYIYGSIKKRTKNR
ncbi:MAG: hypothetical protein IPM71_05795 [Bacteroidota bacterium]|nr:MAG: hypothetical protein IPM71_05795 [Bacteroidota bacterium]